MLALQLVLGGVAIYFAIAGWPLVGHHPQTARPASLGAAGAAGAPARFAAAPGDGVPTPRIDRFDAAAAFALLRAQVLDSGPRPAGSPASRRLAYTLRSLLPAGRFEPVAGAAGLRNVVGSIPGREPAIVVGAHYDTVERPRGFVGANDGAGGTAIVVELARELERQAAPAGARAVRFVLFDGEEQPPGRDDFLARGLRGSKAYVRAHPDSASEMILLDYVAARGLRLAREGSSDRELWRRLRAAAGRAGTSASFPDASETTIYDDHTPFLRAGVPSIDLIDWDYPWVHVLEDDLTKVSRRSVDVTGETVLELLRSERVR